MPASTPARVRRTAAVATVGVLIMSGALTGTPTAPGDPAAALGYTCQFPAGLAGRAGAQVTVTVPARGTPGKPIQPDQVAVTVTLAPEALRSLGAAAVSGKLTLTVAVTQNKNSAEARWSDLAVPATPVPAEGELAVTASGAVAAVTVAEPGDVAFVAGDLGLELVPTKADGSATDPAGWSVSCALNPGQDATLATVSVPEAAVPSTSRVPSRSVPPSAAPGGTAGIAVGPSPEAVSQPTASADIPPECRDIPPFGGPIIGCAYITGFATVKKLDSSILVEPALASIATGPVRVVVPGRPGVPPVLGQNNAGEIAIPAGRLPPLNGSFLAFGFAPISATLEMSTIEIPATDPPPPTPPLPPWRAVHLRLIGETQGSGTPCQPGQEPGTTPGTTCTKFFIQSVARVNARVFNVKVNGVPLDVGPNCRPERPLELTVIGRTPEYVRLIDGGPLRGVVDIPPFSGCGVTEDLDPLLTGMVSGSDNLVRLIQGGLCDPVNQRQSHCPPTVPANPPPTTGSH